MYESVDTDKIGSERRELLLCSNAISLPSGTPDNHYVIV